METATIPDSTVFLESMILKMIQDSQIQDTKIPEMFQNTTVAVKSYLKTVMTPNIDITNDFPIDKGIVRGIQIMILVGILTILQFPEYSAAGFLNYKESVDPAAKTFLGT